MTNELKRFGWCWDHSTNWTSGVHGRQTIGTNRQYLKRAEVFLSDYKRLLDFLGSKRFSGLCVWGLVRQSHGGPEAAKEIVHYGRQRGISVTPGLGLFAYGGAFYEGNHEYNLETFALKHPECTARIEQDWLESLDLGKSGANARVVNLQDAFLRRTRPWVQLCPSNPRVISWVKEAISWAIETLDLRTVQLEAGDVFVCRCDECQHRRTRNISERFSLEDLCAGYIPLVKYLHRHYPTVEIQCEMYAAPGLAPPSAPTNNGGFIPEDCVSLIDAIPEPVQLQLAYNVLAAEEQLNIPHSIARKGILRTECGTQWRGPRSHCCADFIAAMCHTCRKIGIPAVSVFVEEPDTTPAHWINYEAFETFSNEEISMEKFLERDIAPHLGGLERARKFVRWASNPKCGDTKEGVKFAREGARAACDEEEFLKWAWLARFIAEYGSVDDALMLPTFG